MCKKGIGLIKGIEGIKGIKGGHKGKGAEVKKENKG